MKTLSRRTLLRGACGAALSLPLLEAMMPKGAQAQADLAPRRLIIFWTGNGLSQEDWWADVNPQDPYDYKPSKLIGDLSEIREHCLFIEGSRVLSRKHPKSDTNPHEGGCQGGLTGSYPDKGGGYAITESIDQRIARETAGSVKFPSLHLGVWSAGAHKKRRPFVRQGRQVVNPNDNPRAVYDQLFSGLVAADDTAAQKAAELRVAREKRVLDAVMDDYRTLSCKLGMDDRVRLEQHTHALAEIEQSIGLTPMPASGACTKPQEPANGGPQVKAAAQVDLLAMALACDLTRSAGFMISPGGGNPSPTYDFLGIKEDLHVLSHKVDNNKTARAQFNKITKWHSDHLVRLVKLLKSLPEGNGTAFDNTVILWSSEIAHGSHGLDHSFTLVGGDGAATDHFKFGRYLKVARNDKNCHNGILISLLNYMGIPVQEFGVAPYSKVGPLAAI